MDYQAVHENKVRGTFRFPVEYHYVTNHHPRYAMPFHWHTEYEILHILSGSFELIVDGVNYHMDAGQSALLQSGSIHGGFPKDCIYECCILEMERFFQNSLNSSKELLNLLHSDIQILLPFPADSEAGKLVTNIFDILKEECAGREIILTGLLWQLWGTIERLELYASPTEQTRNHQRGSQIKKVLHKIRQDYATGLTLEDLAAEAEMSPKYLCRIFQQVTGRTPIDFLNFYRMELASELLCATDETITEIALECGYNDMSYFTKVFKNYKGMTPSKYRKLKPLL